MLAQRCEIALDLNALDGSMGAGGRLEAGGMEV